tara:strand:+ start:812 stop:1378 length:567 start_codon:yes stop_codon:yes gene_type:complete
MVAENYIQDFTELYKELCEKVTANIEEIAWQDLWHNQVNFLQDEHPFPTPALFYAIRIIDVDDLSEKAQDCNVQVDMYHYFETFADTYVGSYNQESALAFLQNCKKVYQLFHSTNGESYSGMRRIAFTPVDTGDAGNLYRQSFVCQLRDLSAMDEFNTFTPGDVDVIKGTVPIVEPNDESYKLPTSGT